MIYLQINRKDNEYIALRYAKNDKLVEEKNGRYDIEFEYPLVHEITFEDGKKEKVHNLFKKFAFIKCDTPRHGQQLFFITDIQKLVKGVKIYAKHIAFLSRKLFVKNFSFKNKSCSQVFDGISSTISDKNNFVFYSDIADIHTINLENKMLFDVLYDTQHSISTLWQGTFLLDNYNIKYLARRGKDTEYIIANRKNVSDINIKQDADSVATRLYMRSNKRSDKEEDRDIIFETVVESPLINEYPFVLADYREYTDSFRTQKELEKYGQDLFKVHKIDLPKENFTLVGTDEINSYNLDIDDTCLIYYEDYNIHKRIDVISYTFSPMEFRYIQVDFGYKLKSLTDTVLNKTEKKIKLSNDLIKGQIEKNVESKIDRKVGENNEKVKEEIDKNVESKINESTVILKKLLENIKSNLEAEIEKVKKDLDEETVKSLSKAETEKYIRSKEGQKELIKGITADIVWLKAIVTDTEILNTITANIDIAKIKKLIVDTALIEKILSKEEFVQQFEDRGVNVVNIFSKLKDSITQHISLKIKDNNNDILQELNSRIEQRANAITQSVSSKIEDVKSEIAISTSAQIKTSTDGINLEFNKKFENLQIGAVNMALESRYTKNDLWFAHQLTRKKITTISDINDGWNGFKQLTFTNFKDLGEGSNFNLACGYSLHKDSTFYEGKKYVVSFLAKNYREFPITFWLNGFKEANKVTLSGNDSKRIVLKATKGNSKYSQIAVSTHKFGYNVSFAVAELMVEEGTVPSQWRIAPSERVDKDNVISSINLSEEGVKIRAKNIELDGDTVAKSLTSKKIYGTVIEGATINGSKIKIGDYGFLQPARNSLQINVPDTESSRSGIGVQIHGKKKSGNVPAGMFIYRDDDFTSGGSFSASEETLLMVAGYIEGAFTFHNKYYYGNPIMSNQWGNYPISGGLYPIRFIGYDTEAQAVYFTDGNSGANTTWWVTPDSTSSDIRLKFNIKESNQDCLDLISKINFKSFDWKKDGFGKTKKHTNTGIIADELELLDDSLVYTHNKDEEKTKYIDDFRLLAVTTKAVQELNKKVEELELKIKQLEER